MILGSAGEVIRVNPAAVRIFGLEAVERALPHPKRLSLTPMFHPDGTPVAPEERPTSRALRGETVHGEVQVLKRPGAPPAWLSMSAAPVRATDGSLFGVVATSVDITTLHVLQEQRDDLLRAVSHDIRQPLTVVRGQAQLLISTLGAHGADARTLRGLQAIEASGGRISRMIEDLADAVRLESGQLRLRPEAVDLPAFVRELVERLGPGSDGNRVHVRYGEEPLSIWADPDALERILSNLIGNALKYSPADAPVAVVLEASDEGAKLSVRDNGEGIASADMPHLFERYYRVQSTVRKANGLGLGLYITKGLVTAHGGRIEVESELGKGSTFTFYLPPAPESNTGQGTDG
jgi:signal transduction histidine kinase